MATTMEREIIDLNLNCSSCVSDNASIKEEIRRVMIEHEIIFRQQVTELHRLYWTQKNLMHNSYNNSIPVRSDWNKFLSSNTNWVRNDFEIGETSFGTTNKGKNIKNSINLEKKLINLDSEDEEEEIVCLPKYETVKHSDYDLNLNLNSELDEYSDNDLNLNSEIGEYSGNNLNLNSECCAQFSEQTHEIIALDSALDKNEAKKPLLIDLNEDPTLFEPNPIKEYSQSLNESSKGSISATEDPDPKPQKLPDSNINEENIVFAAETLVNIRSQKVEMIGVSDECISEDSFVIANLNLEEIKDDASWLSIDKCKINENNNEDKVNIRSVSLRRGRGFRDFQRDVLPGLVSLSRNEICEDLHAFGFELRKNGCRGGGRKNRRKRR